VRFQFQSITQCYKQRTAYKSISTINPAITEHMECLIVEVRAPTIDLKVGVLLDHSVSQVRAGSKMKHSELNRLYCLSDSLHFDNCPAL